MDEVLWETQRWTHTHILTHVHDVPEPDDCVGVSDEADGDVKLPVVVEADAETGWSSAEAANKEEQQQSCLYVCVDSFN